MNTWDDLDRKYGGSDATPARGSWDALDAKHSKATKATVIAPDIAKPEVDFSGNLRFATPFGTIDTGIGLPQSVNRRLAQLGSGFADVGLGARQLVASNKPTLSQLVTGETDDKKLRQEAAVKRSLDGELNNDIAGKSLNFAGKVLPFLAAPAGWARGLGMAAPLVEGVTLGAASGAMEPVAGSESRGLNSALGAAGGAVLPAVVGGVRAISRPANNELTQLAAKYDIPVGIADTTQNKLVKATRSLLNDLPLTGSIGAAQSEAKQTAFNKAVGGTFGAAEGKLTPQVMDSAKGRMGAEFDRIWNNNELVLDPQFIGTVQRLRSEADKLAGGEGGRLHGWIDDVLGKVQTNQNGQAVIPGDVANRMQSSLRKEAAKGTGFLQSSLEDLRKEVIGTFNRSVSQADAAGLTANRMAYKNFKTVEPLLDKGAVGVAGREAGDIPAALLPEAVRRSFGGLSSQTNQPALAELARVGSGLLADRTAQTGGSARALVQNTGLLAGLGIGGAASPASVAIGIPAAAATQWALGSPAVRKLLTSSNPERSIMSAPLSVEVKQMLLDALKNSAQAAPAGAAVGLLGFSGV